jgi:hypothetical protein
MVPNSVLDIISTRVRPVLDDQKGKFLWSDGELVQYLADGQEFSARDAFLLPDETSAFTQIAINTTDNSYALDASIVYVNECRILFDDTVYKEVKRATKLMLNALQPRWRTLVDYPENFVEDVRPGYITLSRIPSHTGTMSLSVYRLPLVRPSKLDDTLLELHPRHIPMLVQYVLFRAYEKHDSDTNNMASAKYHSDRYDALLAEAKGDSMRMIGDTQCFPNVGNL